VFVFVKVDDSRLLGASYRHSYPTTINVERLMCEVEFWEVCFFGTRYIGLFNVLPNPTPHYQIVDLESLFFSCFKLLKNRQLKIIQNRLA